MAIKELIGGWLPVNIVPESQELLCKWMFTGNTRFSDPFFSDTLLRCKQLPENKHGFNSVSSLSILNEWTLESVLQPSAFIFHVSRCGSTALTQLLDLDPANRVLSEVPLLDEILRLPYTFPGSTHGLQVEKYFRGALAFYSQSLAEEEKRLYIKTDSWHLHFYPLLRRMYPDTPFIIITRAPVEVLQSQRRQRGIQSVPGMLEPALFGLNKNEISLDLDRHMEKVLESYYERIILICQQDPRITLFDYRDGMENMLNKTLRLTGAAMPDNFEQLIKERLQFDGKNPGLFFTPLETEGTMDHDSRCMELYHQCQRQYSLTITGDEPGKQR